MLPCRRTAFTMMIVVAGLTLQVGRVVPSARAGTNVWTSDGLSGQQVRVLAIDPATPTTIYAVEDRADGSRDTLLKSIDGGATWNAAMTGLTPQYFLAVLIDPSTPSTLYVGSEIGVFKSTDGAATWSAANTGLTYPVLALAIDPTTPSTLYAAGAQYGVSTSTDGGATWTTQVFAIAPYPPGFIDALAVVGTSPTTI